MCEAGLRGGLGRDDGEVLVVVVVEVEAGRDCVCGLEWERECEWERDLAFRLLKEGARGGMVRAGLGRWRLVAVVEGECELGRYFSGWGEGSLGSWWMVKVGREVL